MDVCSLHAVRRSPAEDRQGPLPESGSGGLGSSDLLVCSGLSSRSRPSSLFSASVQVGNLVWDSEGRQSEADSEKQWDTLFRCTDQIVYANCKCERNICRSEIKAWGEITLT